MLTFFGNIPGWIGNAFGFLFDVLTAPFFGAWTAVTAVWSAVQTFFGNIPGWIQTAFANLWAALVDPFARAWSWISQVPELIKGAFRGVLGWFMDTWQYIENIITNPIQAAADAIGGLVGRIKGYLGSLSGGLNPLNIVPGFSLPGFAWWASPRTTGKPDARRCPRRRNGHPGRRRQPTAGALVVNVYTTGLGADSPAIGREVAAALRNHISRNGPI